MFKDDTLHTPIKNTEFVETDVALDVLSEIQHAINCDLPIMLYGATGVGKTSIVEEANMRFGTNGKLILD